MGKAHRKAQARLNSRIRAFNADGGTAKNTNRKHMHYTPGSQNRHKPAVRLYMK